MSSSPYCLEHVMLIRMIMEVINMIIMMLVISVEDAKLTGG